MQFNEYQKTAKSTAVYPANQALPYLALGLAGEAGEVANKIKKILRGDYDSDPAVAETVLENISYELGDVLWYVTVLADELGTDLETLAKHNAFKLKGRMDRGKIKGDGDVR